jgi:uncharacterized protein (DUF1778 family)
MSNQATNGSASHSYTLALTEQERQAIQNAAAARGTSVSNYVRSQVPELKPKSMGRPKSLKAEKA